MKVLLVTCGLPYPANCGGRMRDFHLLRELSSHAEISLFSLLTEPLPPDISELKRYCSTLETFTPDRAPGAWLQSLRWWHPRRRPLATLPFYFPAMAQRIRALIAEHAFDVVQFEHSFLACYRDAVPADAACATVLSFHNVGSQQYRRMAGLQQHWLQRAGFAMKAVLMRDWEAALAARFDLNLVVSAMERQLLLAQNPSLHVETVDNGVDCERIHVLPQSGNLKLFFVGVLSYPPNTDGILWFANEIFPLVQQRCPGVHLTIAGLSPPPAIQQLASGSISVKGFVQDLEAEYRDAGVVLVPLRAGGGTRLKVLEAMAYGRAVVSTTLGSEGIAAVDSRHLLIADHAESFADAVCRSLQDASLRDRLCREARALVEARYSWQQLANRLLDLYREVLPQREGVQSGITPPRQQQSPAAATPR